MELESKRDNRIDDKMLKERSEKIVPRTGKKWYGYRRRPAKDSKSPFELLFRARTNFNFGVNSTLQETHGRDCIRELEKELVQTICGSIVIHSRVKPNLSLGSLILFF